MPEPLMVQEIDLNLIIESKTNPRSNFDKEKLHELAQSIKEQGLVNPITLRPGTNGSTGKFELVAGARRLRASKLAGLPTILAMVRDLNDKQVLEFQVIENLQRDDLTPLDEARGYDSLIKDHGYTVEKLAAKVGRSISYIAKRARLTSLSDKAAKLLHEEKLPLSHAILISRIPNHKVQDEALSAIKDFRGEWLSVIGVQNVISSRFMLKLADAPFDIKNLELVPAAGACGPCEFRTGNQKELFDDIKGADICTKSECYQSKVNAWWKDKVANADANGELILSDDQVSRTFKNGDLIYDSNYVNAEVSCHAHPKRHTFKAIVKDNLKPTFALVDGRVWMLYPRKDLDLYLRNEKWYQTATATPGVSVGSAPAKSPVDKKKDKVRLAVNGRIKHVIQTSKIGKVSDWVRVIFQTRSAFQLAKHIPGAKDEKQLDYEKKVQAFLKKASTDDLVRVLSSFFFLDIAAPQYSDGAVSADRSSILKLYGIDLKKLEKDAEEEYDLKVKEREDRATEKKAKVTKAKVAKHVASKKAKGKEVKA